MWHHCLSLFTAVQNSLWYLFFSMSTTESHDLHTLKEKDNPDICFDLFYFALISISKHASKQFGSTLVRKKVNYTDLIISYQNLLQVKNYRKFLDNLYSVSMSSQVN